MWKSLFEILIECVCWSFRLLKMAGNKQYNNIMYGIIETISLSTFLVLHTPPPSSPLPSSSLLRINSNALEKYCKQANKIHIFWIHDAGITKSSFSPQYYLSSGCLSIRRCVYHMWMNSTQVALESKCWLKHTSHKPEYKHKYTQC